MDEKIKDLIHVTNTLIFALQIDGKNDKSTKYLIDEAKRIVKSFIQPGN
jgi:hypothetical protein